MKLHRAQKEPCYEGDTTRDEHSHANFNNAGLLLRTKQTSCSMMIGSPGGDVPLVNPPPHRTSLRMSLSDAPPACASSSSVSTPSTREETSRQTSASSWRPNLHKTRMKLPLDTEMLQHTESSFLLRQNRFCTLANSSMKIPHGPPAKHLGL